MKNKKIDVMKVRYAFAGILAGFAIFLALGIPTALIPNPIFARMIPPTIIDYVFLSLTSILLGAFVAIHFYGRHSSKGNYCAFGGTTFSIFALSCPLCSALLVSLLGTGVILTYFEPFRPVSGLIGVALVGTALLTMIRNIRRHQKIPNRNKGYGDGIRKI